MKYILTLLCFAYLTASAQEPVYTPMRQNYQFRGIKVDSLFLIPSFADTTAANARPIKNIAGAMIRTGNDFWMRNAATTGWLQNVNVGTGVSPVINFVNNVFKKAGTDSVFYVKAPADTVFSFKDVGYDTTSLSNRINTKVDSIKRSNDSVYFKKNGFWFFAFKDSLGQSQNFANANLSATGDRTHDFNNNDLFIDTLGFLRLRSTSISKDGYIDNNFGAIDIWTIDKTDNTYNALEIRSDSIQIGGYDGAYEFYGLSVNNPSTNVALKRGPNRALLSRRNFGTDTLALKSDITGASQNFANTNLSATGNRSHNFKNKNLTIDSIAQLSFNSYSGNKFGRIFMPNGDIALFTYDYTDGSTPAIEIYKDSIIVGAYDGGLNFYGLGVNGNNGKTFLQRGGNYAYLSHKNFGTDTIALLSDITGGTDSPDRIDGTATNSVTADMDGNDITFDNVNPFRIAGTGNGEFSFSSSYATIQSSETYFTGANIRQRIDTNEFSIKDFNSTLFTADTLGNSTLGIDDKAQIQIINNDSTISFFSADPMTWREKASGLTSQVKTGYAKNNIDVTSAPYSIRVPGVYVITTGSDDIVFPDPSKFPGQSFTIWNTTGNTNNITTPSGSFLDGNQNTISSVSNNTIWTFFSTGSDYISERY